MAETKYRWLNVYVLPTTWHLTRWHLTRESADLLGKDRIRCDRYRVDDNGILVYDPEPEPEPVPESIDEVRYVNPNMLNPYWTQAHIYTEPMGSADFPVRVRDKAADDKLLEQATRREETVAMCEQLTRERDEAMAAHAKASEQAYAIDDERIRRIAELERELAEAKAYGDTKGTFADKQNQWTDLPIPRPKYK